MFKKIAQLPDPGERLEIYNMLKLNLAFCRRLAEFMTLAALIAGFGLFLGRLTGQGSSGLAGAALLIGLMLLIALAPRWIFKAVESSLAADFGLDPRPWVLRLKAAAARESRRFAAAWVLSVAAFWGLSVLDLWVWTLAIMALGSLVLLLNTLFPRFLTPEAWRFPGEGERNQKLLDRLNIVFQRLNFQLPPLRLSASFTPELTVPRLVGLGPTMTVVIPEKALACFPPREMALLTAAAAVEGLVKAPFKILCLRLCALVVSGPLAAVMLGTLGAGLWLYPFQSNPALITLVWLAGWFGWVLVDFSANLVRRDLTVQLAVAAAIILKDSSAVIGVQEILASRNLEEANPPAWKELFRPRLSRQAFMKRFQFHLDRAAELKKAGSGLV